MRKNSMKYLTLWTSFWVVSCTSTPKTTRFDGKWEFIDNPKGETKACLAKPDVQKLRELLIRCQKGD